MILKVLYLRSSFDPGGTETLLLNLFNYPQSQIEFHYAFLKDGNLISKLQSDSNKYYKIFRKRKIDFFVLYKLSKIIKSENIKVVHTHQMFELFYAVLLKTFNPKIKIFHTIHGYFEESSMWTSKMEKFLVKATKQTFTVSNAAKNILIQKGYPSKKITVLYNAVNMSIQCSETEMNEFRNKIRFNSNDFIAGMVGNFVWQKDQLTIIKAFNLLKDKIPELKIILIGKESNLSAKCKEILNKEDINNRVFFLGAVENASKYLPIFNLFIMSTLMDTFGIVVIEALINKVPVIASDIEVMNELSNDGKYFELFEKQNYIDLAERINIIYKKNDAPKTNVGYQYAVNNFCYTNYINKLKEIYTKQ